MLIALLTFIFTLYFYKVKQQNKSTPSFLNKLQNILDKFSPAQLFKNSAPKIKRPSHPVLDCGDLFEKTQIKKTNVWILNSSMRENTNKGFIYKSYNKTAFNNPNVKQLLKSAPKKSNSNYLKRMNNIYLGKNKLFR